MSFPDYYCQLVFKKREGIFKKFVDFFEIVDGKKTYFWTESLEKKRTLLERTICPKLITISPNQLNPLETETLDRLFKDLKKNKELKKYDISLERKLVDFVNWIHISKDNKGAHDQNILEKTEKLCKEDLKTILSTLNEKENITIEIWDGHQPIKLRLWNSNQAIRFSYGADQTIAKALEENKKQSLKIAEEAIEKTGPNLAYFTQGEITTAYFEYYSESYYFCIEPEEYTKKGNKEIYCPFLDKKDKKLEEIKKVLPKEKLLKLIKKYSNKTIRTGTGIIVIRKEKRNPYIYPRYFIRKEIRKLGIELPKGKAEGEAERIGIR